MLLYKNDHGVDFTRQLCTKYKAPKLVLKGRTGSAAGVSYVPRRNSQGTDPISLCSWWPIAKFQSGIQICARALQ